jgi:hypothetical protein
MAELQLPKLLTGVRFSSSAPVQLLTVAAGLPSGSQVRKVKAFGERFTSAGGVKVAAHGSGPCVRET